MKVLIIQPALPTYRLAFFKLLGESENIELTVMYGGRLNKDAMDNGKNPTYIHKPSLKVGKVNVHLYNPLSVLGFDKVICHYDISWPINFLVSTLLGKKKYIFWGIGLGQGKTSNLIKHYLALQSPLILYYQKNIDDYLGVFPTRKNLHSANNTVGFSNSELEKSQSSGDSENRVLTIGTLDERKKLDLMLNFFAVYKKKFPASTLILDVVGAGIEKESLISKSRELGLEKCVIFHGKVTGPTVKKYFDRSLAACSFGQAGLSILQSFYFGVPYITNNGCVSGGEVSAIEDGRNGLLLDSSETAWVTTFESLEYDSSRFLIMGVLARETYTREFTLEHMVSVFRKVIFS